MKTFNTYYQDPQKFQEFLYDHAIIDTPNLLIQIFGVIPNIEAIQRVIETIAHFLPTAHIIGATSDGEILDSTVSLHNVVVSITEFESTTLRSFGLERSQDCKALGLDVAQALLTPLTKVILTFADGINTNGEDYLEGLSTIAKRVYIAGGLAGDVFNSGATYVFTKDFISSNGAVGVSLNNEALHVHTDYNFNWTPIGKPFTITRAEHNRVYTIDDKTAIETYAYYLGAEVTQRIPSINIEFPLILSRKNTLIARAAIKKNDDGSICFAGNLKTGDKVHIGFGNTELILHDSLLSIENAKYKPIESVFIYSCMARRRYMQEACSLEIEPWAQIAPSCGFFTYGEFYTTPLFDTFLMNQTMTILALSERENVMEHPVVTKKNFQISNRMLDFANSMKALSHFINVTSDELTSLNRRLSRAIDGSKDGLWSWNLETNEVYFSLRFKEILGYKESEFNNTFMECLRRLHPHDKKLILKSIKACQKGQKKEYNEVFRMKHKDGTWVWIHSRGTFFYNESGKIIRASGFHTDITHEKVQALEIEKQRGFFQAVINGVDASIIVVDQEEDIILTNKYAQQFFVEALFANPEKPTYKELHYQTSLQHIADDAYYAMQKVLQTKEVVSSVEKRLKRTGEFCDMEIVITPLLDERNELIGAIEVAHDISEHLVLQHDLEIQKQHLKHVAHHDTLTGLSNRLIFSDKLSDTIKRASYYDEKFAVLFIDLDHFKNINDTLGHDFGDAVLKEIAKRFKSCTRGDDVLARLGGDEFIVLIDKFHSKQECVSIAQKLLVQANIPILYKNKSLTVSASIGISVYPTDGKTENHLLKNADSAMYQSKKQGGHTYSFYGM